MGGERKSQKRVHCGSKRSKIGLALSCRRYSFFTSLSLVQLSRKCLNMTLERSKCRDQKGAPRSCLNHPGLAKGKAGTPCFLADAY